MRIEQVDLELRREPFARPFGFKGACFHEKWNAVVRLTDELGHSAIGVGGLATLWADAEVFLAHTENGGNCLMLAMLEHALQIAKAQETDDPMTLLDAILPETHAYGKTITRKSNLSQTFTLNALVALDNAAWVLYARRKGIARFDDLIPGGFRRVLAGRQERVAALPLITYAMSADQIKNLLEEGSFFLKVKIGQPGSEGEMLRKDMARLAEVHAIASAYTTPATENGKILYYLDANGRYREKDTLLRLLDHAGRLNMLGQVALVEEPFAQELCLDVHDIPARLAADESVHGIEDVDERLDQGYTALAIKPAGKTLTMAFRMAARAAERNVPCYVADNACVPVLVDWNKNIAARLPAFPGLPCGLLESNGPESYGGWDRMLSEHPCAGAAWLRPRDGAFWLDQDFYERSGGVFLDPMPYAASFRAAPGT